ncbi:MAG TPA: DUF4159 domain-containing protein [Alphaproteobacteria bacterium]|nr:DUF4159 domain-containing protein [Alphaproteobacteria bacterium]
MLELGFIAFANPLLLAALASLPLIWWLLRVTPPAPRHVRFPPIRLLFGLEARERTPSATPLWLIILRMILAALIILALADPILSPSAALPGGGPVVLVVDDGWAAARDWAARKKAALDVITRADRSGRQVMLITTAPPPTGEAPPPAKLTTAADARSALEALQPKPWPSDRTRAVASLERGEFKGPAMAVWVTDGLEAEGDAQLGETLQHLGGLIVVRTDAIDTAHLLMPPRTDPSGLKLQARRAVTGRPDQIWVRATTEDGRMVSRAKIDFAANSQTGEGAMDVPLEIRNRIARLAIEGEDSAGGTVLIDERYRRRAVGIPTAVNREAQPLLSERYYLARALEPFAEVREGRIDNLIQQGVSVMTVPDSEALDPDTRAQLRAWVEQGGTLVRFAGPRLAERADDLVPVKLRTGGRTLGGALSWAEPAGLAPFGPDSPFAGITVSEDVKVERQVLAEPTPDLAQHTWAQLQDGTPLITAANKGQGRIVLVHTTANGDWSNLALSGLFVEMLRRIVALSAGTTETTSGAMLPPFRSLDGFGRLTTPPPAARPIEAGAKTAAEPAHPPGLYGGEDASSRFAFNLADGVPAPAPVAVPSGAEVRAVHAEVERALKPSLLTIALMLAIADTIIALLLRGLIALPGRRAAGRAAAGLVLAVALAGGAQAQPANSNQGNDRFAMEAAANTRLAYVVTHDAAADEVSRAGLTGLTQMLVQRTAVEPEQPIGVDLERDELAFFPMLYWPMTDRQQQLSRAARERIEAFLKGGGTIVFDTRDRQTGSDQGPGAAKLQQIATGLDLPALQPVPPDHILTKSFYLLQDFPGRWDGGKVWVEANETAANDGVSSIIVGSNDWAAAWATDERGRPLYPTQGGERQREMAFRFGINLVMYVLTGNYKADQVHVPAILERLGQ